MPTTKPATVAAYIAAAPKAAQPKLRAMRAAILAVAPKAEERMSYGMPYYAYKGRLAYFGAAKKHVGLYVMPPVVADHNATLKDYVTAKATVQFPLDAPLPVALIKKLVRAGLKNNEAKRR